MPSKLNFQKQSSVSHDHSEIILICWVAAQDTFLIIISDKQLCYLIFLWKLMDNFSDFFDE